MNEEKVQKIDVKAFQRLEKEFLIVKRLEKGNFDKFHDVLKNCIKKQSPS